MDAQYFIFKVSGINREILLTKFSNAGIDIKFFLALVHFRCLINNFENGNAYDYPERSINLPSFHDITTAISDKRQF